MVYDGFRWERFELPNKTIIRFVKTVGDTIFIGTYEDFGFYIKDEKGTFQYTSIAERLPEASLKNLEFWQIDDKLYRLEGEKFLNGQFIGGWYPTKVPEKDYYFRGLNTGLGKISINKDKISEIYINGFTDPIKYLCFFKILPPRPKFHLRPRRI